MSDTAYGGIDPALKRLSAVVLLGAVMTILDTTIVAVASALVALVALALPRDAAPARAAGAAGPVAATA